METKQKDFNEFCMSHSCPLNEKGECERCKEEDGE